ncbi:unnamed protein product [Lactuca saligna]|uniref:Uncharacterized protein n=1 Tax=Lactuca saligna TaxID=75948 RepID=A0AA35Z7K7_LACSI|nr:unnamed protein product [Lactuca saligna]
MASKIMAVSGEAEKSLVRPMKPLDGGQVSVQEEHTSNRMLVSQTPFSSTTETTATYIANQWHLTVNLSHQVEIITTTMQIVATQQTEILVSQQQFVPHSSSTRT